MAMREIRKVGDPVLRTPCDPITVIADAQTCPDVDVVVSALQHELNTITREVDA